MRDYSPTRDTPRRVDESDCVAFSFRMPITARRRPGRPAQRQVDRFSALQGTPYRRNSKQKEYTAGLNRRQRASQMSIPSSPAFRLPSFSSSSPAQTPLGRGTLVLRPRSQQCRVHHGESFVHCGPPTADRGLAAHAGDPVRQRLPRRSASKEKQWGGRLPWRSGARVSIRLTRVARLSAKAGLGAHRDRSPVGKVGVAGRSVAAAARPASGYELLCGGGG